MRFIMCRLKKECSSCLHSLQEVWSYLFGGWRGYVRALWALGIGRKQNIKALWGLNKVLMFCTPCLNFMSWIFLIFDIYLNPPLPSYLYPEILSQNGANQMQCNLLPKVELSSITSITIHSDDQWILQTLGRLHDILTFCKASFRFRIRLIPSDFILFLRY